MFSNHPASPDVKDFEEASQDDGEQLVKNGDLFGMKNDEAMNNEDEIGH